MSVAAALIALIAVVSGSASAAPSSVSIDTPPPLGSGGWYDSSGPITSTYGGDTVSLTVTALQPGVELSNGSFSLSWKAADFTYVGNGDSSASCSSAPGSLLCTYTNLGHSAKSDSFTFVANGDNANASVKATVAIGASSASEKFPLAINAPVVFDQSSAWGYDGNFPVNTTSGGQSVTLSFGEIQPDPSGVADFADGTFSLSWSPASSLTYVGNGDTSASCGAGSKPGASVVCTYTDLAHGGGGKDDSFTFVAAHSNKAVHTTVTATVTINGYSVSYEYPLVIQPS